MLHVVSRYGPPGRARKAWAIVRRTGGAAGQWTQESAGDGTKETAGDEAARQ